MTAAHRLLLVVVAALALAACSAPSTENNGTCTPSCDSSECGDDGCGGSCGSCDANETCVGGTCASESCGNEVLDDGETCDDSAGNRCPTESGCEPLGACFEVSYSGSPETCDAVCDTVQVEECITGDGCCPASCNPDSDRDCVPEGCGNGVLDPGETCDEPEHPCITEAECQPTDACDIATLVGYDFACVVSCQHAAITTCGMSPDGCCAPGCTYLTDTDCEAPVCGNSVLEMGEICETGLAEPDDDACPTDCEDNRACTTDVLSGTECTSYCQNAPTTACTAGDDCCPPGCTEADDADCANVVCGDGVVDGDEGCDNTIPAGEPGACPASDADCDDGDPCTTDAMMGNAGDCSARCVNTPIDCADGDGCCPYTCSANEDAECAALALCDTMCFRATNYCADANEIYASMADCLQACADFPSGRDGDSMGDSVQCRMTHLLDALDDPDNHCQHASASPADGCNDPL